MSISDRPLSGAFAANARPLAEFLGRKTRKVIANFDQAHATVLHRVHSPHPNDSTEYGRLTEWLLLTTAQRAEFREILSDPASYWHGLPIYRRLPPKPGFAVRLTAEDLELNILIDLENPGWEFFCGAETHWGFNFAGGALAAFAKRLFPEYASSSRSAVWKRDAFKYLTPFPERLLASIRNIRH